MTRALFPPSLVRPLARRSAALVTRLERRPLLARTLRPLRASAGGRLLARGLLAYHRLYESLDDANACAARYLAKSHSDPANLALHLQLAESLRNSDYPVLFHLRPLVQTHRTLFDLGGNTGNLFYSYRRHCPLPDDFRWTLYDLPETLAVAARIAEERGAGPMLRSTARLEDAAESAILLASGSAHYFEPSLPEMLARLPRRPLHVLLNRTPLIEGPTAITIQDAGHVMLGCKLFNVDAIVSGMEQLGYEVVDRWSVPELSVRIPLYPERSAPSYSGFYFRLR